MGYTIAYVWEDLDAAKATGVAEQKFGDHHSTALNWSDAVVETEKYIRSTLGKQKHKIDAGRVIIHRLWDVSAYAQQHNRFGPHKKVDDLIRVNAPLPGWVQADIYQATANDLIIRVNRELTKAGQPLPVAGLSTYQYAVAEEVLTALNNGQNVVLAELCARFGKTLWAGVLAKEQGAPLTIVASYVKTVFSSFAKDLTSFEQFAEYEHVDTQHSDYQATIKAALKANKPVIAYLSMCKGTRREERIDFLFGLKTDRFLIVDEADFGVHRDGQSQPLIAAVKPADRVVLMTGTNADRAVSDWQIDMPVSVTYPELLLQKAKAEKITNGSLMSFDVDTGRDGLFPDLKCYQMDLSGPVERAFKLGLIDEDFHNAPSWAKFAADPTKAKGFWSGMLEAVFLGKNNMNQLNIDYQLGSNRVKGPKVAMLFLPSNIRVEMLEDAVNYAQQALPGFKVLPLSGGVKINGRKTSNAKVEGIVKQEVAKALKVGQSVLLISSIIAQRSFSIPEITELYLAYDQGEVGSTIQKMSRVLTPAGIDKVGNVVSLSFDPNRDDKFDSMVIETALNSQARRGHASLVTAVREVLDTIDIFDCTKNGSVPINVDQYLNQIVARNSLSRVIGKASNVFLLSGEEITALASGNNDYFRQEKVAATPKGKVGPTKGGATATMDLGKSKAGNASAIELKKAREVIAAIVENMDIIILGSDCDTLDDALQAVEESEEMQACVQEEFGVPFSLIKLMFDRGVIKQEWIEVMYDDRSV